MKHKTAIPKNLNPAIMTELTLGRNAQADGLYGCFRLHNPKGDAFTTEREVEIVLRSDRKTRVTVPESMRVDLPASGKVVNSRLFRLEPIGKHRDSMHLLTMRAGWNQTDRDINRMIDLDPNGTFVARLQGKGFDIPVATSSVLPLGRHNTWIGMILVHPEARRQGIANAMMQQCVQYAIDNGKIVNGLDATPMGNTVYGAVGYVNSYRIWRSIYELAEFADTDYDRKHVRAMTRQDLAEVIRYDATRFLDREAIMRQLFDDGAGGAFLYGDDQGAIQGYCYTRPGRIRPFVGPFIAENETVARELIVAASRHLLQNPENRTAFIDTPESKYADRGEYVERVFDQPKKPAGHRLLRTAKPVRDFMRMYQLVADADVARLVAQFQQSEGLAANAPRIKAFRATMEKSVANYTVTRGFMEYERAVLQEKFWGITGPEKG